MPARSSVSNTADRIRPGPLPGSASPRAAWLTSADGIGPPVVSFWYQRQERRPAPNTSGGLGDQGGVGGADEPPCGHQPPQQGNVEHRRESHHGRDRTGLLRARERERGRRAGRGGERREGQNG